MENINNEPCCRICFNHFPEMQNLCKFLPLIRLLAHTELYQEKDETSKICKSCANCLILGNLIRIKVIESNAKYRALLSSLQINNDKSRSKQTMNVHKNQKQEIKEQTSESTMQIEAQNDFFNESFNNEKVQIVKANKNTEKKSIKEEPISHQEIQKIKENLKLKIIETASLQNSMNECFICTDSASLLNPVSPFKETLNRIVSVGKVEQSERLCDKCFQNMKLFKTFFTQLNKTVEQKFSKDKCQFCSCKNNELKNASQNSFNILNTLPNMGSKSRIHNNGKTCVTCEKVLMKIKTSREKYLSKISYVDYGPIEFCKTVAPKPEHKTLKTKPKTEPPPKSTLKTTINDVKERLKELCKKDVNLPIVEDIADSNKNRLKEICQKDVPSPKISVVYGKNTRLPVNNKTSILSKCGKQKKELISRIMADMSCSGDETKSILKYNKRTLDDRGGGLLKSSLSTLMQNYEISDKNCIKTPVQYKKKRILIRAEPRYILPDPDEPLPEDYQCHMSDFEELDSDYEVPSTRFRAPLNVPFAPNYLTCPDCATKFVSSYELEAHIECMHRTTSEVCNICNKKYKDISSVKAHKTGVHFSEFSAVDLKKQCDTCGILTKKFEEHTADHLGIRPFVCELCSYAGKTKFALKSHISAIHKCEKRFKCKYCNKGFNYAADRGRHVIGVHTKQFKYICQVCKKCFLKKNFLTAHMRSQHPDTFFD